MPNGEKPVRRIVSNRVDAVAVRGGGNIMSSKQGEQMNSGLDTNLLPTPIKHLDREAYKKFRFPVR